MNEFAFSLEADDPSLFDRLKVFAGVNWLTTLSEKSSQGAETPAVRLVFHSHLSSPILPTTPSNQLTLPEGIAYLDRDRIFLVMDQATLVIESDSTAPFCVYGCGQADNEALGLLFTQALQAALRRADCFELHAAAAASPQGAGVLFIGDSGCGKSTLTVRLAGQGWRYLTDDSLLLRERESQLFVTPLRRVFALTPQTLHAVGKPVALTNADKVALEPAALFPAGHITQFAPRHLVFPKLTYESRSSLAPLTQANAMMRLLYHSPWACFDALTSRAHVERLTRLAQSTRAWELNAGRDLLEVPDAASAILTALA